MSFDGEAIKLLGELSTDVLYNYDRLVQEMDRRFNPLERASAYKIQFRSRTLHHGEDIMKYAHDLRRLVLKAYPHHGSVIHDTFVLDQFVMGLTSLDMRKHVQFNHPRNLNHALSLAIEFDSFHSSLQDSMRKPRPSVNMVRPADEEEPEDGETSAQVCALGNQDSWGKSPENRVCYFCGSPGHYRRNCAKYQKFLQEKNQGNGMKLP
jgi:hypothetical protein